MDFQEKTEIIDKILWGKSLVSVKDSLGQSHSLILRSLTSKENNIANYIYKKELEISKLEGLLSLQDLQCLYEQQDIWGDKQEQQFDNLRQQVKVLQADIKDSEFFRNKKKKLEKILGKTREKIKDLESTRDKLFVISYENRAEEVKRRFLIMMSAENMEEQPLWGSEKEFLNDADSELLYNLAWAYYKNNVFVEKQLREIARSGEWRFRWQVARKGADLFGKSISNWSETQGALVYWSQFYDGVFESPNFPGNAIVNNDEACDAWVREQNHSLGSTKKEVNPAAPMRARAKRTKEHQEQFLFVEPGDKETINNIKEMNSEKIRTQLKSETEFIKKKGGRVSEWQLRVARQKGEIK